MKEIIIAYDENAKASPVIGDWISELVRCKDCKWKGNSFECRLDSDLEEHGSFRTKAYDDWFCADGERADT